MHAALGAADETVTFLLSKGANPDLMDNNGKTALFGAIQTITVDESVAIGLPPIAKNYTLPNQFTTIDRRSLEAIDLAQTYLDVDQMTPELTTIIDTFEIGATGDVNALGHLTQQDAAWRTYRLKGTQTN